MSTTASSQQFTQADYLIGIEGLAILRASFAGDFGSIRTREEEIRRLFDLAAQEPYSMRRDLPPGGIDEGYGIWAATYDHESEEDYDPIIQNEQPIMRRLMDGLVKGRTLDVGCGTGRHSEYLVQIGHDVTGTDAVQAMLDQAQAKPSLSSVAFTCANVDRLPFADATFDNVVCGLTLLHVEDLRPAVQEIGRVLKPGGRFVASIPHPFIYNVLGWRAPVFAEDGSGMVVPEYGHPHSAYIEAFGQAGLTVRQCFEPALDAVQARWNPAGQPTPEDDALEQALIGQPAVLIWEVERV